MRSFAVLFVAAMCISTTAYGFEGLEAKVPFSFMIDGHQFPAGNYRIKSIDTHGAGVARIWSMDGIEGIFTLTRGLQRVDIFEVITTWHYGEDYEDANVATPLLQNKRAEFCLVFEQHGGNYYLSKMWVRELGREFINSMSGMAARAAGVTPKSQVVVLAAVIR